MSAQMLAGAAVGHDALALFASLWLAIALSTLATFFLSFLSWGVLGLHRGDFRKLPEEQRVIDAVRGLNLPPGRYLFPYAEDGKTRNDARVQELYRTGPVGELHVWRLPIRMPVNMLLTMLVQLVVCALVGYLASTTLARGAGFGQVLQVAGTAGVLGFTFAGLPSQIWFQSHTSTKVVTVLEGVVTGLVVGLIFAGMWPR